LTMQARGLCHVAPWTMQTRACHVHTMLLTTLKRTRLSWTKLESPKKLKKQPESRRPDVACTLQSISERIHSRASLRRSCNPKFTPELHAHAKSCGLACMHCHSGMHCFSGASRADAGTGSETQPAQDRARKKDLARPDVPQIASLCTGCIYKKISNRTVLREEGEGERPRRTRRVPPQAHHLRSSEEFPNMVRTSR